MNYFCCDDQRREAVRNHPTLTGIDYLEVLDGEALPLNQRQRTLIVHLIEDSDTAFPVKDGYAQALAASNVIIEGGDRIRNVKVLDVKVADPLRPRVITVSVDQPGDFSSYALRVVKSPEDHSRLDNFDPLLSSVAFSFKVECDNAFDCKDERICPPDVPEPPNIDYLARDYASFRRLMLDRMSTLMPDWLERNAADLGITLVELLAYVADHLSYQQDAIATEAYLSTARRRTSVRRHARLVDYRMHDGHNARAWVHVQVTNDMALKPFDDVTQSRLRFLTRMPLDKRVDESRLQRVLDERHPEGFEPMHATLLFAAHNNIQFYTWGANNCCLPKGATRATLNAEPANRLRLRAGDVLIFEERIGPETGNAADANPAKRHAVRLIAVQPEAISETTDGIETKRTAGGLLTDPLTGQAIVEVMWAAEDKLRFPLCISSTTDKQHGTQPVSDVSVAMGNIVLADHGLTLLKPEPLGMVPKPDLLFADAGGNPCTREDHAAVPPRFRPSLLQRPLTQASAYDAAYAPSASAAMRVSPQAALPAISLTGTRDGKDTTWRPQRDLLNSGAKKTEFVAEVESDLRAYLRFGDDAHGMRPQSGTVFAGTYRVGNGARGNVGADAITHFVALDPAIEAVRNPLPALGGVEIESSEDVRARAPYAFRTQERAVTAEDYAGVAERNPQIQQAAATFRWTGSWRTAFVTTDRVGGRDVDPDFETAVRDYIEPYRMAGQDVEIDMPHNVPLEVTMHVCAKPDYFRSNVKAALLALFSSGTLPDGRRGVFHPDNFTFGQPVYLSQLYAAAQAVDGVASVQITQFERRGRPSGGGIELGKLTFARLEIPGLDNDPNFPDRGVFHLIVEAGK